MSRRGPWLAARLLAVALLLGHRPAVAQPGGTADGALPGEPLREQVLTLDGDPQRPVSLQVTFFTPPGPGPWPLAVMNHGATHVSASNRGERYRHTIAAYYFLSRGYAVALPMMRGFAGSGGELTVARCDLARIAQLNARDIAAVIGALAQRPDIDGRRIIVAGQSFGGWNTLGVGAAPPSGVRGLIAFNAAIRAADCHDQDNSMIAGAGELGARTALPSVWFYGENDTIMPVATWHAVFDHYAGARGRAELVDMGRFKDDSHQFLGAPESLPFWSAKLDAFLSRIGMPSAVIYPGYLPHPAPPATRFAALSDVAAVPFLNDRGRAFYQAFLASPRPRAIAIAPDGPVSRSSGGYDPIGAALRSCSRQSARCGLYAVNDDVVWTAPIPAEAQAATERLETRTVPMNIPTSLGTFFGINADCSPRGTPRLLVAAAPAHGSVAVGPREAHPEYPPDNPSAACNGTRVPGVGLTYTPKIGYTGGDMVLIDETSASGRHQMVRFMLTIL